MKVWAFAYLYHLIIFCHKNILIELLLKIQKENKAARRHLPFT